MAAILFFAIFRVKMGKLRPANKMFGFNNYPKTDASKALTRFACKTFYEHIFGNVGLTNIQ